MDTLVAVVVVATVAFISVHEYWARQAREYEEIKRRRILGDQALRVFAVSWSIVGLLLMLSEMGLL